MPTTTASRTTPAALVARLKRWPKGRWARLLRNLAGAPSTAGALAAVGVFLVWAEDEAGQALTSWLPGGLLLLGLLGVTAWAKPPRLGELPRVALVALGAMTAYTAWSFLTIAWAGDAGTALEGADRTLLYLAVLALFALWRQRGASAALILGTWTLGMIVLAVPTAAALAGENAVRDLFFDGRLIEPAGYVNAAACLWLMPVWPALALASSAKVPWPLRGAFAGGAVLLCDLAILVQSRGSIIATPILLILWMVLLPDRVRRFAILIPVALGVAATAASVLDAGQLVWDGKPAAVELDTASQNMLVTAALVGIIVAAGAAAEVSRRWAPSAERTVRRGFAAALAGTTIVAVLVTLVVAGNPFARLSDGWDSFKGGYAEQATGSRLVSGLGSNRYDFYRVGLDVWRDHPVGGIGADGFYEPYLRERKSDETTRYAHSMPIRTLSSTGTIGALLLAVALGAALWGGALAARRGDPLARAVAIGCLGASGYWLVHSGGDWFWEVSGLGAPAFAFLGLGLALAPAREPRTERRPMPVLAGRLAWLGAGGALLVAAALLAGPWLAERNIEQAAGGWQQDPAHAFEKLDRASTLNPVSDRPFLFEGAIAIRRNDLRRADRAYARALERDPGDAYALLERGAIAATLGDRAAAQGLLRDALAANPRDPYARDALEKLTSGRAVDVRRLNLAIARGGAKLDPRRNR